jgi:hypothetical protein
MRPPNLADPRDQWPGVVQYFEGLSLREATLKPLARLAQQISASKFADALHAWTSAHDLCLAPAQTDPSAPSPYLLLRMVSDAAIEFRYVDTAVGSRQWSRVESADLAFGRLLIFFDQLNWFAGEQGRH